MSLISEIEIMFNKIDNTIAKKIKQKNYVHDNNILAINNKFDSNKTTLDLKRILHRTHYHIQEKK